MLGACMGPPLGSRAARANHPGRPLGTLILLAGPDCFGLGLRRCSRRPHRHGIPRRWSTSHRRTPRPGRWTWRPLRWTSRGPSSSSRSRRAEVRGSPASSTIAAADAVSPLTYGTTRPRCASPGPKGRPILRRVPLTPAGKDHPGRRDGDARGTHPEGRVHSRGRRSALRPVQVVGGDGVERRGRPVARGRGPRPPARRARVLRAAARAPGRPCANPLLRTVVTPTPTRRC